MAVEKPKKGGKPVDKVKRPSKQQGRAAVVVQQPRRPEAVIETAPGFQRVDEETLSYFQEVKEHYGTLEDAEERALLVSVQLRTHHACPLVARGCLKYWPPCRWETCWRRWLARQ